MDLHYLPDHQGLPYLAQIATRYHLDFGEDALHAGELSGPVFSLLDVAGASNQSMAYMAESAEGRETLMELDAAGALNRLSLRLIRYDEGGYGEEICAALPGLSACVTRAILRFDAGHETTINPCSGSDDYSGCQEAYRSELRACATELGEDRYTYRTAEQLACRDEVMIRWISRMPPG